MQKEKTKIREMGKRDSSKKDIQRAFKHMKRCLISLMRKAR